MAGAWGNSWGTSWGDAWGGSAAVVAAVSRAGRKPVSRTVSAKSLVIAADGQPEQPYPVYRFSNRQFVERPKHNPFKGL